MLLSLQRFCKPTAMKLASIAEMQPILGKGNKKTKKKTIKTGKLYRGNNINSEDPNYSLISVLVKNLRMRKYVFLNINEMLIITSNGEIIIGQS